MEQIFRHKNNIVLVGHFNPDGDSIGSLTGMYYYLAGRGCLAKMIVPNSFPDYLKFLDPADNPILVYEFQKEACCNAIAAADLIICLDFNKFQRTEWMADLLANSPAEKMLIDHHPMPEKEYFKKVISSTDVSSTCEILYQALMEMPDIKGNVQNLTIECATSLFTGMLTDTNNFSNSLFPSTFRMASELLSRGVDRNMIYNNVFCSYSENRMRLMGKMLQEKMTILPKYGVGYIMMSLDDKEQFNFSSGDSEGFVNMPLAINGVVMSALFAETNDFIRVSFRSKGNIDVNAFSRRHFNGGGHVNASGGRLYIPFKDVPDYFAKCLSEFFDK